MSRLVTLVAVVALVFLAAAVGAQSVQIYDPKTVVTVQGQVESLESAATQGRWGPGQTLRLKTATETVLVHLGPAEALAQYNFAPKPGDALTVTGSKLTTGQGTVIVAAEVKAGDRTITLRDSLGRPTWQGPGTRGKQRFYSPPGQGPAPGR